MANIRKINVGGTTYDIAPSANPNVNTDGIFYVTCDTGSTTSVIKSDLNLTSYYTGLKLVLYYSLSSASSTNLSININNLGNKGIKRNSAGSSLQHGFGSGTMHFLCYDGTVFVESSYVDTDTNTHDYRNPVSGGAPGDNTATLIAGENLGSGLIIFKALADNSLVYSLNTPVLSQNVNPDWGLGVYIGGSTSSGAALGHNNIIQQGRVAVLGYNIENPYSGSQVLPANDVTLPVYAFFHYNGSEIEYTHAVLYTHIPYSANISHNLNTFVYLGLITFTPSAAGKLITSDSVTFDLDISNHDFITIDYENNNPVITHINGRSVGGGGGNATYDNPVSPDSYILLAGDDLYANTLIFKGEDGIGRRIAVTNQPIDPDWGLGYVTQYTQGKSFTNPNTVFQQYMVNSSSGDFPYLYNYNYGEELYLCCDFVTNQIYSLGFIGTYDECRVYHSSNGSGDFTYIYLGIVASIDGSLGNNAGHVLALDLSNHDFITVGTLSTQDQKAAVKAINGRLIRGSDSSTGGGWDGICHNALTYSYLSNRTVDPSAYHYPCVVTRYENKAFLYTLNSSERGAYIAYAHVTVHNDDSVQHTVEISLCANSVGLTSSEPITPVWTDINQKTATYLEIPPYRSATVHMTTPIRYDYKDGNPELLGYGFVIRNDENRHCSIIGAHEASIIVTANSITSNAFDASAVHQAGRQFYRAAQFDISGEKPQYAWCSSGIINNLSAAGIIIYTSDDTQAVTPGYTTVDGSTVTAVFKGINPSTGGAVTGTTCGVYQIGTDFGHEGNSYSYVSVPAI